MELFFIFVAFAVGIAAEFINYLITRSTLKKKKEKALIVSFRAFVSSAVLILLYFSAGALNINAAKCVISYAIGATIGLVVFTFLLIRENRRGGGSDG